MYFFTHHSNYGAMLEFLRLPYSKSYRKYIYPFLYEHLLNFEEYPEGLYVFADLDIIDHKLKKKLVKLSSQLKKNPNIIIMNDPEFVLNRYELQKVLYEKGINQFQTLKVEDLDQIKKYPVFVRSKSNHAGPISNKISNKDELLEFLNQQSDNKDLLIIEFQETDRFSNGACIKYSMAIFNGQLYPAHLYISDDWNTKGRNSQTTQDVLDLEKRFYLDINHEHIKQLKQCIELAGIDYGRIDYGLCNGKIQVWEINTNHRIIPYNSLRKENYKFYMEIMDKVWLPILKKHSIHQYIQNHMAQKYVRSFYQHAIVKLRKSSLFSLDTLKSFYYRQRRNFYESYFKVKI